MGYILNSKSNLSNSPHFEQVNQSKILRLTTICSIALREKRFLNDFLVPHVGQEIIALTITEFLSSFSSTGASSPFLDLL